MQPAAWITSTRPGVGYVKLFVNAAFGYIDADGTKEALVEVRDFELRDTREGELYLKEPERPVLKKQSDGAYQVQRDEAGKPWYLKTAAFPSLETTGTTGHRLTKAANQAKQALQAEAIAAFRDTSAENAGRGAPTITSSTTSTTSTTSADDPTCPKCGGRMWDNRLSKRNPKAPDFKCRDRSCDGVMWPARTAAEATRAPTSTDGLPRRTADEGVPATVEGSGSGLPFDTGSDLPF